MTDREPISDTVSVIVPCFNAATTLARTLESALRQISRLDIIVIDDGSSDDSLAIARGFESRVRVFAGPNKGASDARNRGIAEAHGQWIIFLDADDQLTANTIEQRLHVATEPGGDVVICDWQDLIETETGLVEGQKHSIDREALDKDAELACATHVWAPPAAIMYRRALVEKIGGFSQELPVIQDARFLFDAAYHGGRFVYSPHLGARYRVSEQSLSRRNPALFWRDVLTNGMQIESLWSSRGMLSANQRNALAGIYNHAARGLFAARHPDYLQAVDCQRQLGRLPLHPRIAAPLVRAVGLRQAGQILSLLGR